MIKQPFTDWASCIPCGLFCISEDGTLMHANEIFAQWLQYDEEALLGRNWLSLLCAGSRIYTQTHIMPLLALGQWVEEIHCEFWRADGTKLEAYINAKIIKDSEECYYAFSVFRNVLRRKYEDELLRSKIALEENIARLQTAQEQLVQSAKLAAIGRMVGGVAHEINNPLNFIYGAVEALCSIVPELTAVLAKIEGVVRQPGCPLQKMAQIEAAIDFAEAEGFAQDAQVMLKSAQAGASRITQIVRGLLLCAQDVQADVQMIDIHDIMHVALGMLGGSNFNIKKDFRASPMMLGRPNELSQAFINILLNATEHTAKGGTIEIATYNKNEGIIVTISDTGPGIEAHVIDKIFDPFFTTKPAGQGIGLGLSVAQGVIMRHKGYISVQSELGKGSTFYMFLPVL